MKCIICEKKAKINCITCSIRCRNIHNSRISIEKRRISSSFSKLADKNPNWKGDKVGYTQLHAWLRVRIKRPKLCQKCRYRKVDDLANKGIYDRDFRNWEWLCRRCHMVKDGRLKKLLKFRRDMRILFDTRCPTCGIVFLPQASKVKCCSNRCGQILRRKNEVERIMISRRQGFEDTQEEVLI